MPVLQVADTCGKNSVGVPSSAAVTWYICEWKKKRKFEKLFQEFKNQIFYDVFQCFSLPIMHLF